MKKNYNLIEIWESVSKKDAEILLENKKIKIEFSVFPPLELTFHLRIRDQ